jgi:hypothetical protein
MPSATASGRSPPDPDVEGSPADEIRPLGAAYLAVTDAARIGPTIAIPRLMKAIAGVLLLAGCSLGGARMDQPGYAELFLEPDITWIEGEPNQAQPYWAYACDGTGDWGCPSSTITILDIGCDGCSIPHDPTGKSAYRGPVFDAIATTDGTIRMTASLRFNDTGATTRVVNTVKGDREVALEGLCQLIDTATLAKQDLKYAVQSTLFRECDASRSAADTVVVFPTLRTARDDTRFPFCPDDDPCVSRQGAPLRRRSAMSFTPPVTGWAQNENGESFAILGPLPPGPQTIAISAPLLPTGTATTTVELRVGK